MNLWSHLNHESSEKLFKQLSSYFEEALYQNSNNIEAVNLTAIAKENDAGEIAKLGFLIVAAAVQCEANQNYIAQIRSLDEAQQHSIMVAIEKIMARLGGEETSPEAAPTSRSSMERARGSEADDSAATRALQEKLSRVQGQYVGPLFSCVTLFAQSHAFRVSRRTSWPRSDNFRRNSKRPKTSSRTLRRRANPRSFSERKSIR
jgi:hypothetical protein